MNDELLIIALHLLAALAAGGIIGIERGHHARPAGFRTHALVCLATCALMMMAIKLPNGVAVAQGIVTGIGFLGAGVIFKEGLNVRGLTTAAAIWMTAALGILIGSGLYLVAAVTTMLTLIVLTLFRWLEVKIPTLAYGELDISFARNAVMPESELIALLHTHGFSVSNISYRTSGDGNLFSYNMVIRTTRPGDISRLSSSLRDMPQAISFAIQTTSNDLVN
ncbi:MAG TPA: MgtC/SapB family protein [Rhodocyclaceae bacterium]|jgi:putative Mg2+ transporter-C (MgtC) family protein|nr:MgtC/SapB family protein [Rhodocyclaceae bacterium]